MSGIITNKATKAQQYYFSILLICLVSAICFMCSAFVSYRVVALLLLLTVSFIAMTFNSYPVLIAALLSALIWDFFFVPPRFNFAIHDSVDLFMLLMYFIIVLVNTAMTRKIRKVERAAQQKEDREQTVELYNTILNSLSHELRTPISTIIGATDNLLTEFSKLSEQNRHELLTEISKASIRLDRQVENLLNMSRLESGFIKPKKDWCDINELAHDVVNRLKENLGNRTINVQITENLPLFKIDFGLIEQALSNLIYNAALYTQEHSIIKITAGVKDEKLLLTVEDNGKGFPEDEIDKVFEKFYRLKNTNAGGTGLGLSIVKGFVEAHNGTVQLVNIPEGGARFTIVIPAETTYINNLKHE